MFLKSLVQSRRHRNQKSRQGDSGLSLHCRKLAMEPLEDRRMLSGLTLITHGWGSGVDDWVNKMADAIRNQVPQVTGTQGGMSTAEYTLKILGTSTNDITGYRLSQGAADSPATAMQATTGEVVMKLDWSDMAGSVTQLTSGSTTAIGTYVANLLLTNFGEPDYYNFLSGPIHLIGHSRGASLNSVIAEELGKSGVWIDQFTTLDPHPSSVYGDEPVSVWSNVQFADNYWESCDLICGNDVAGSHLGFYTMWPMMDGYPTNHSDVHLWYHGTIDTSTSAYDGSFTVPASWYGDSTSRDTSGYYYSRILGGSRPLDGITESLGGSGYRETVTVSGPAWPNIIDLAMNSPDVAVPIGGLVHLTYRYQDSDSNATTTFYLDPDQNPYNGNEITTDLPRSEQITGVDWWDDGMYIHTDNAQANTTYYVCAKITDGTHTRYAYAPGKLTVEQALHGTDLSTGTVVWDDRLPAGDNDGVMEAGETVRVQVPLQSDAAIKNVNVTVTTITDGITITPVDVYYGDFTSGQTKLPDNSWNNVFLNFTLPSGQTTIGGFTLNITYEKNDIHYTQTLNFTKELYWQGDHQAFTVASFAMQDPLSLCDRNNNDNLLQTGEQIYLVPQIQLNGIGSAKNVRATLIYSGTNLSVGTTTLSYGDLTPGQATLPLSGHFWIASNNFTFTGTESIDVQLQWDTGTGASTFLVLPGAIRLTVKPAAVLEVTPRAYDFGVVAPGTNVTTTLRITNRGTAQLNVTNVLTSNTDTTISGGTSFSLAPQGYRDLPVTINTSVILGGTSISRVISMVSPDTNGPGGMTRLSDSGVQSDRSTITGLVSSTIPIYPISLAPSASNPDVSLSWVVYQDSRSGNNDIFAYNIETGVERRITTNSAGQSNPRIDGNIVVWQDDRNVTTSNTSNSDIYGYDLSTGTEFAVSTDSAEDILIGVDDGKVAFARYYNIDGNRRLYNLWICDVTAKTYQNVTNWSSPSTQSITSYGADFGDGLLVWSESTGKNWLNQHICKMKIGTDSAGVQVASSTDGNSYVADGNTFVGIESVLVGSAWVPQVFQWNGSSYQQITSLVAGVNYNALAVSDGLVVYRPAGSQELRYLGGTSSLLTNQVTEPHSVRMDGNCVAFCAQNPANSQYYVYYALLNQPDISIASAGIGFSKSNPLEGEQVNVSVIVKNLTDYAVTGNMTVRLYDDDPDVDGTQWGMDQVISGGVAAQGQTIATFSGLTTPNNSGGTADEVHQIYARVFLSDYDATTNNTAYAPLHVYDNDTQGPTVSNVLVQDYNGNGDGSIATDEQIKISWIAVDSSGVSAVNLQVDDASVPVTGNQAILGPLAAGTHQILITALDADNSSASSSYSSVFDVLNAERIGVLYQGNRVPNGATLNVGDVPLNASDSDFVLIVRNEGGDALTLGALTVQLSAGSVTVSGPMATTLAPGSSTYFTLTPGTLVEGSFACTISLENSDPDNNAFVFFVHGMINAPDTTSPTVTINRASSQASTATTSPINFTVVFSEAVTGFSASDLTLSGTSPGTRKATVTGSGTTYNVAISGMTGTGTITAAVKADAAQDAAGNLSKVSTSTATVSYICGPAISLVSTSVGTSADKTTITFSTVDPKGVTSVKMTIDGKNVSISKKSSDKYSATYSYAGKLSAGKHIYVITAVSVRGTATYNGSVTVAATTPVISKVSAKATKSDKKTTISWNVADIDGVGKVQLSIDGGTAITIGQKSGSSTSAGYVYSAMLAAGTHTFKITAADATGKAAAPYSGTLTVSATTPTIKNVKVTAKTSADNTVIAWTVYDYDKVKSTTLKIDGVKITSGITQSGSGTTISYTYAGKLSAGKHTYMIDAVDAATVPASARQTKGSFTVTATKPTISNVKITATTVKTTILWNAYDIDKISGYKLTIDGKTVTSGIAQSGSGTTFAYTYTGVLKAGSHSYAITATDVQKKSSTVSGKFTVTIVSSASSMVFASIGTTGKMMKTDWLIDYDSILFNSEDDIVDAVFA